MDDVQDVRRMAGELHDDAALDPLLERVGDAHLVMIGEASHGTHEFYAWRDRLTRRLVAEKGFSFIAVEGDWPDCRRLHRWIVGDPAGPATLDEALTSYDRWPTWMWANTAVRDAAQWLRSWNDGRPRDDRVAFHGLDVYSLTRSMREVVRWLQDNSPELAGAAKDAYKCFQPFHGDPQTYAMATRFIPETCEAAVLDVLRALCDESADGSDERFVAEQNAAVVAGAERYYRSMVQGSSASWNARDTHMADTLDRLLAHHGPGARGVVWAHNTHVGDARATDMAESGMVNIGELARERHGDDGVVLVGFAGHRGTVLAGDRWGSPARVMPVPAGREASAEDLLHTALGDTPSLLVFPPSYEQPRWLRTSLDHRAIGVVYRPERERWGNYVPSTLGDRYDAMIWLGGTSAVTPLRDEPAEDAEPETFPFGE
jgi:erythromycin esterase